MARQSRNEGLTECRQQNHILGRYRLQRIPRLTPGAESAHDHIGIESVLDQVMRHPGAGRFPHSSAVNVNLLVLWQLMNCLSQLARLQPDRAANSRSVVVVVTLTAHIYHHELLPHRARQLFCQLLRLDSGHDPVYPVFPEEYRVVCDIADYPHHQQPLGASAYGVEASRKELQKPAKHAPQSPQTVT